MACSFFDDINWDDIYKRVRDGPWVPPADRKRSKSSGVCILLRICMYMGCYQGTAIRHFIAFVTSEIIHADNCVYHI